MRADRVEFYWDDKKSSWLIRIQAGEEVIQRHCSLPRDTDDRTLNAAIVKTVADEGYEIDPKNVVHA